MQRSSDTRLRGAHCALSSSSRGFASRNSSAPLATSLTQRWSASLHQPANPLEESSSEVRESISHDDLAKLQAELERRAALISDLESAVAATKQQYGGDEKVERRVSELEELLNQARTHNVTAAFLMQAEVRTVRVQLAEAELKANDAHAAAQASVVQREQAARELRVEREAERSAVAAREALDNDRVARITELENMLSELQVSSRALEDGAAIALSELDATRAHLAAAEHAAEDRAARIGELEGMLSESQTSSHTLAESSRENIAQLTNAASVTMTELHAARAQLAVEQTAAKDRARAHETLDQLRRLLTDSNAELDAARSTGAEYEARRAEWAARDRARTESIAELEGALSELQANSRYFEESARKDIARLTESSALALSELEAARAHQAIAEQMAADERAEARSAIDRVRRLAAESQAELERRADQPHRK